MTPSTSTPSGLPPVAGVEWSLPLDHEIQERMAEIGCLEIIPENFLEEFANFNPTRLFEAAAKHNTPIILHSIGLSLGSVEPFKQRHFQNLLDKCRGASNLCAYSDHLCLTEKSGSDLGQLTPIFYNEESLDCLANKIDLVKHQIGVPFLLENISYPFAIPDQEIDEPTFINRLLKRVDSKLLLDLHNIHTNQVNFGIDAVRWLAAIDLNLVGCIHLAGGYIDENEFLQDGHCSDVPEAVWDLYEYVLKRIGRPVTTIVERTSGNEKCGLSPTLADQVRAQSILDKVSNSNIGGVS